MVFLVVRHAIADHETAWTATHIVPNFDSDGVTHARQRTAWEDHQHPANTMSSNETDALQEFKDLTGAPDHQARFFLESANWDLEVIPQVNLIVDCRHRVLRTR
jgi:hypothetical protein